MLPKGLKLKLDNNLLVLYGKLNVGIEKRDWIV